VGLPGGRGGMGKEKANSLVGRGLIALKKLKYLDGSTLRGTGRN